MQRSNSKQLLLLCLLLLLSITSFSQLCIPSQYFNGQRCAPCKPNCICTSDNTCDDCLSGYAFDATFSNCLQCPTAVDTVNIGCVECCSQISGTSFVCSECQNLPYVFMRGGQCVKLNGCLALDISGMCSSCVDSYYLDKGVCVPCDASCKTCHDSTLCLTCSSSYYNKTNVNYALCGACSIGCNLCSSSGCSTCLSSFYLSGTTCLSCGSYCLTCSSNTVCSLCDSSSTLISGTCFACINPLKSGSTGCSTCITQSNAISCTKCDDLYYLNNGQCTLCSVTFANSLRCTAKGPTQCKDDYIATLASRYHLVSGSCILNTNNCKVMASSSACSSCYFQSPDNYYRLNGAVCTKCVQTGCLTFSTTCQCLQCQQTYRYVNNLCVSCQNLHCIQCQSDVQSCQACAPFYGLFSSACVTCSKSNCINCDGDYTKCQVCSDGYYLSEGTCFTCQTNCLLCTTNTKCTKCAAGAYLQNNGRCKTLPTNCLEVDSNHISDNVAVCKKCKYGYQVLLGNCYPCSQGLFNLNQCQKYCPNYYALLKYGPKVSLVSVLLISLLLIVS